MALVNSPEFLPASFRGRAKLNAVPVYRHQLPVTGKGYIELLEGEHARFGNVVSQDPRRPNILRVGRPNDDYVPVGVLYFEEAIAQGDPAHNDEYFDGEAVTYCLFGEMQYSRWFTGYAGISSPTIGAKVYFAKATGEVCFADWNDAAQQSGDLQLMNATVIKIDEPNCCTVFFGLAGMIAGGGFGAQGTVSDPRCQPEGGAYAAGTEIVLSCDTVGADIYYTMDGDRATGDSTLYEGPIRASGQFELHFIAVKAGMANSMQVDAGFSIG
jgi:hypothetical protein